VRIAILLAGFSAIAALTAQAAAPTLTTLYSFTQGDDGYHPEANVILGPGGASNSGTVFQLTP
jgi:hypothetical protein